MSTDLSESTATEQSWESAPRTPANASNHQLARNFATGYLGFGVAVLLGLLLTPLVLRRLGTQDYGLWIVITTVGGYLGILGGGVETAAVREIAACIAANDMPRLREVTATSRAFFLATGALAGLIILALVPFVSDIFGISQDILASARISLTLTAAATSVGMMINVPQTILFGTGRTDKSNIVGLLLGLASQGGQIVAVLAGAGYLSLFVVSALQVVVGYLILGRVVKRSGLLPPGRARPTKNMLFELLRSGRRNVAVSIAGTLSFSLDAVLIGTILPVARVTPYDLGYSTATFVRGTGTAGTNLMMPTYAHSATLDDRERQFRLWSRSVLASSAVTIPMVVALITFGQSLLQLWIGQVPPDTYWAMVALNAVFLLQLPGHQSFIFLTGAGRNALLARLAILPALANVGLSIAAIFWLGPVGPAVASVPQVAILDFCVLPVLCCRHLGMPVRRYLSESIAPLLIPAATSVAIALVLMACLGHHSLVLAPIECVLVCVLPWGALGALLIRRDPALKEFLVRLLRVRKLDVSGDYNA